MFINTLRAEWTKLRTTASFWWTTGIVVAAAVAWTLINSMTAGEPILGITPVNAASLSSIMLVLGLPVLMIQAAMVVTTEYRYKLPSVVYLANPRRWMVAVAKLLLSAFLSALIMFLMLALIYALAELTTNPATAEVFNPLSDDTGRRILWVYPLAAAGAAMFIHGLGWLMRQTAGTVAVFLILYMGVENLIRFAPKIGEKVVHFLPFEAFGKWTAGTVDPGAPWDSVGMGAVVFFTWAAVLWVLGVLALHRRDA